MFVTISRMLSHSDDNELTVESSEERHLFHCYHPSSPEPPCPMYWVCVNTGARWLGQGNIITVIKSLYEESSNLYYVLQLHYLIYASSLYKDNKKIKNAPRVFSGSIQSINLLWREKFSIQKRTFYKFCAAGASCCADLINPWERQNDIQIFRKRAVNSAGMPGWMLASCRLRDVFQSFAR